MSDPNPHKSHRKNQFRSQTVQPRVFGLLLATTLPLIVLGAAVGLWHVFVTAFEIRTFILPPPADVGAALAALRQELVLASARTATAAFTALAVSTLFGTVVSFVFAQTSLVRLAFYPYAILLQTVPIIAIAPLVILTFGRGFHSVTLVAIVISVFPIITNTTTGLLQIDAGLHELFRLHDATWWQMLRKLRLPSAFPWLISGIRIASGTAIVGAIVGEFFVGSSQPGLGALIQRKHASLDLPALYATVIASTTLGITTFVMVTVAGDFVLQRWFGRHLDGRTVAAAR